MTSGIDRRRFAVGSAGADRVGRGAAGGADDNGDAPLDANVLRVLFEVAETGFDPAQVSDLYSNRVIAAHLRGRCSATTRWRVPVRLVPLTAEAMPEVVGRLHGLDRAAAARHPLRRRPGIQGQAARARRRRLRLLVQAHLRPGAEEPGVQLARRGRHPRPRRAPRARAARQEAVRLRQRRSKACARSTATRCSSSSPSRARASRRRSPSTSYAAVAREVVEAYRDDLMAHPVGTGPYRLKSWRRSSRIVLERNPNYREVRYQSEPAAGRCRGASVGQALQRPAPAAQRRRRDRRRPGEPAALAELPQRPGRLRARPAGAVAARGAERQDRAESRQAGHPPAALPQPGRRPVVLQHGGPGGRRLHAGEGRLAPRGPARVRHRLRDQDHPARPGDRGAGADGAGNLRLRSGFAHGATAATTSARAKALLDIYGYVDRNGDGWREQPDGSPLVLTMASEPDRSTASTTRTGNGARQRSASAWSSRPRSGPST